MPTKMDYGTQAMTGFFLVLSSSVNSQFNEVNFGKKQREILRLMNEYGYVRLRRLRKLGLVWTTSRTNW